MTRIVELPPEVETRVREAAAAEGVDVSTFVYESLTPRLRRDVPSALSEAELLAKVREDFPPAFWRRFRVLAARRDAGQLTPEEWKELTSAAEATEEHDAERLLYLGELSRRLDVPARLLLTQLGLRFIKENALPTA